MSVVKKCFRLLQLRQHFDWIPEREVIAYLKSWNSKLKQDEYGNLYLINPGTPLLNAHMDTVQSEQCVNRMNTLRLRNWVISANDAIIWGDDKCWIAIAMEIYEKLWNKVSLLFTRQEETWCHWARNFVENHKDLLSECKYCLTLDRRGSWDIIWYKNNYCSKEFEDEVYRLIKDFWYKPERGLCSDANHINSVLNCVNLSVWYYAPHTKSESIKCDDLQNACEAVQYIVEHLENDYPIWSMPVYDTKSYWLYSQPSLYGWPADDDDDYYDRGWWIKRFNASKYKQKDVGKYFKYKDWFLVVKKDIFVTDINDDSNRAELSEWTYAICEYA